MLNIGDVSYERSRLANKVHSLNLDSLVNALGGNSSRAILKATKSKSLEKAFEVIFAYDLVSTVIPWAEDDISVSDNIEYLISQGIRNSAVAFLDRNKFFIKDAYDLLIQYRAT